MYEVLAASNAAGAKDVRVPGAISVVEMAEPVDIAAVNRVYRAQGVWLRPFGPLICTMPPFIATRDDIQRITKAMHDTAQAAAS